MKGGGPPVDPGDVIDAKLRRQRLRPPGRGDDDDDGTADSPIGGKEMAPTKKGANAGEENSEGEIPARLRRREPLPTRETAAC